jgi:hypothetical protein
MVGIKPAQNIEPMFGMPTLMWMSITKWIVHVLRIDMRHRQAPFS